jgi:hypothetical protein
MTSKTKEFRNLASKIRRSCDYDLRISRRFDRLTKAIRKLEKEHRNAAPLSCRDSYRPLCHAVDLFIIKTINNAFEKIDSLKASDLDVREDYLLALQLISDSRDREILEPYRDQIAAMADRLDYCEDIVIK